MKKTIIICILCIIIFLVVLYPKTHLLDDGGTVIYKAVLYEIQDIHRLDPNSESGYQEGLAVKILGFEIFNNAKPINKQPSNPPQQTETNESQPQSVFNTENIARITFYAYHGNGKGSDVPSEYMDEITNWLSSFTIDEEINVNLMPSGINTQVVEIEYLDGTIIKEGLSVIYVDRVGYYMKHDPAPECYQEIISKTKME